MGWKPRSAPGSRLTSLPQPFGHHIPALGERAKQEQERNLSALSHLLHAGIAAGEFRADLDVEAQARILMATLHGLMVQWHRQPGSVDWHRIAEEIVRGLRASALAPGEAMLYRGSEQHRCMSGS